MEAYAQLNDSSVSDILKNSFFDMLEDDYDIAIMQEHRKRKLDGETETYTTTQVRELLGLD